MAKRERRNAGLDGERATVLPKGLTAGERVAVSNVGVLQDGMLIRVEQVGTEIFSAAPQAKHYGPLPRI